MKQINCYGKINRILRVGSPRSDGFHELFTIYQSVSLFDTLTLELTEKSGIALTASDKELPVNHYNLVWQGAELLMKDAKYSGGISVHIEKKIPSGGGLGGGSSDAAGTLLLLNRMLKNPLSRDELVKIARSLGCDVPFFLVGGTAVGTGRGENVKPLPDGRMFSFSAVFPDISFPTGKMYELLDREKEFSTVAGLSGRDAQEVMEQQPPVWENSFDSVVSAMSPEVAEVMQDIRNEGFAVMLGGSGSTFLVFEGHGSLKWTNRRLPDGWREMKLQTISRREALGEFIF